MFDGLKEIFGTRRPTAGTGPGRSSASEKTAARPVRDREKPRRVNLAKRFQIIAETSSQGSMSKVFRALDLEQGRTVCLKLQDTAKMSAALARTQSAQPRPSEGAILRQIAHPNVVRLFDHGETTTGQSFLVMEFIDGLSLQNVRETRTLTLAEKRDMLAQAADALAAVHDAGFIHHDFGPRNLLVDRDGHVTLIDFGLAIPNTPEFRRPGNRTGTLIYLAPEVIRREPKDERLDLYSWGVTAFEFLSGRLPYELAGDPMTQMRIRINTDPLELARLAPHLPGNLCAIVQKAIARRKEDRPARASAIASALRALPL